MEELGKDKGKRGERGEGNESKGKGRGEVEIVNRAQQTKEG